MKARRITNQQSGFTIVELLIATLVFSIVLMVITYGVMHFTNSYYKGINSSTTQTAAQNAIDSVSQAIQFGGGNLLPSTSTHFCAGNKKFVYNLGVAFDASTERNGVPITANPGLYVVPADPSCGEPTDPLPAGTELLGDHMRLTQFTVTDNGSGNNIYNVNIQLAYGDSDLLCNADPAAISGAGGCNYSTPNALGATVVGNHIRCRSTTGSQFCAVTGLSTAAQPRVTN